MSTLALDSRLRRAGGLAGRRRVLVFLLAAVVAAGLSVARTADAASFPFVESFRDASAPEFALGGNPGSPAVLTAGTGNDAAGTGWLRLTAAANDRFGYAYHRTAFPSADGLVFEFDYAAWGGGTNGADGIAFVLFDGATTDGQFHPGPPGGSLGYTACGAAPGLSNAYMAVGLDEYGNFANREHCGQSGAGFGTVANRISVRGGVPSYPHLSSVIATRGVAAGRADARRVTVTVVPRGGVTRVAAEIRYPDGTVQPIATDLALPTPPPTLKFGFTASTGGAVNNHEIRDLRVSKPTDLQVDATPAPTSRDRNGVQEYAARITNAGPNDASGVVVAASAPHATDVAWTCAGSGGASCPASSGTGLPQGDVGPLPANGTLTFRITSRLTDDADDSSLRFAAEPTGDTTELTPADNVVEARTDVTPGVDVPPTLELSAEGVATATSGRAFGGGLTRVVQWLRCSPAGEDCRDIAGAIGATYPTTDADRGASLRVRETVTNSAGSATAVSLALAVPQAPPVPIPVPEPEEDLPAVALPLPGSDGPLLRPVLVVPEDEVPPATLPPVIPEGDPASDDGSWGSTDDDAPAADPEPPAAVVPKFPAPVAPRPAAPVVDPTVESPIAPTPPADTPIAPRPATRGPGSTSVAADGTRRAPATSKAAKARTFVIDRGAGSGPVRPKLNALAARLRPAKAIRCVGFTDSRGSAARNRRIGQRRAAAVCRTLRQIGVRASLSASSRGEQQPRASNRTAAGRERNRRVELVVRY